MKLTGTIQPDGFVITTSGQEYLLPIRGVDESGYPKVLIDATEVGGSGTFKKQSIVPYVGMEVEFTVHGKFGYNFTIKSN
jgi:hypothetical protein